MKIVCAWCEEVIRDSDADLISHGICDKCRDKMLKSIRKEQEKQGKVSYE
jgi:hypothetical protein